MNNEQKKILDLMARVDNERPFAESDLPLDLDTGFSSTAEAEAAFEKTLALREALRIQSSNQAIPDSWIEQIESFSDTQAPRQTLTDQITTSWRKLRNSWRETPYVWGSGLATACALVLLIGQPFGQGIPQGIGSSIANSDSRPISGVLGGDFKSKTSSPAQTGADFGEGNPVRSELFALVKASDGQIPAGAVEHRVKRIVDGDTIYLMDGTKVRLHGIDTPERDQPYGKQATRDLDKLIGSTVFIVEKDTDRYGRLVGVIYTPEGVNVNLELICNGSAWWYERYAKNDKAMSDCQAEAEEAGLGLWEADDPMPPWEWRRK